MDERDKRARRNFALIVCAMLAVAAYFQARGVAALIASKVGPAPVEQPEPAAPPAPAEDDPERGKRIIEHNVFDSRAPTAAPSGGPAPSGSAQQAGGPPCEGARVVLISVSDDAAWSFAAIEEGGKATLRRVGDPVAGGKLARLAWDRVWLAKGDAECELVLKGVIRAPEPEPPPSEADARMAALAGKIERVSDTEVHIARGAGDDLANRLSQELLHEVQLEPVKHGDKVTGVRPRGIKKGSAVYLLGVRDGDEVQSIGGVALGFNSPEQAFEVFARVREMDRAQLVLVRGGRNMSIDFSLK